MSSKTDEVATASTSTSASDDLKKQYDLTTQTVVEALLRNLDTPTKFVPQKYGERVQFAGSLLVVDEDKKSSKNYRWGRILWYTQNYALVLPCETEVSQVVSGVAPQRIPLTAISNRVTRDALQLAEYIDTNIANVLPKSTVRVGAIFRQVMSAGSERKEREQLVLGESVSLALEKIQAAETLATYATLRDWVWNVITDKWSYLRDGKPDMLKILTSFKANLKFIGDLKIGHGNLHEVLDHLTDVALPESSVI